MCRSILICGTCVLACHWLPFHALMAQETDAAETVRHGTEPPTVTPESPGWIRLDPKSEVWINRSRGAAMVGGKVCLRDGFLEMFACPRQTKEHESIVSVNSHAFMVHAALLALGVKAGKPASFDGEYAPAEGREIDIHVVWNDDDGKPKRIRAQEWIREIKTASP